MVAEYTLPICSFEPFFIFLTDTLFSQGIEIAVIGGLNLSATSYAFFVTFLSVYSVHFWLMSFIINGS